MKCPICANAVKVYLKSQEFEIRKCDFCGFGITKDLKAQRGDYHRDEEYLAEEKLFRNIFKKRAKLISKLASRGSVLEIGCSTGLLLYILKKKGFDVTGIEISKKAAKLAQGRGIKVLILPFEKISLKKRYNIIIFSHTLEHLKNPIVAVKKASGFLKERGILFIDLPNFNSVSSSILKENWPHLLPKEHLWHFTYKALEILLKKNNLKIIYSDMSSGIWDLDNPFGELLTSFSSLKKRFFVNFVTAIPTFILSRMKIGSGLMVIARKI